MRDPSLHHQGPAQSIRNEPPGGRPRRILAALAVSITILAVGGMALTVTTLHHARAAIARTPVAVGTSVGTSYGELWVNQVQRVSAMSHDDMGGAPVAGMDMGIAGLVPEGSVGVRLDITLVNTRNRTVNVTSEEFRLLRDTAAGVTTVSPVRTTLAGAGQLPAKSSIEAQVTFVVPADGATLQLSYRDAHGSAPRLVDLGRTDVAPTPSAGAHHH